jgi:phosphate transport system substrate-binding protein
MMNRINKLFYSCLLAGYLMLLGSCAQNKAPGVKQQEQAGRNKVYKGELNVMADAGLESVLKQEQEVFEFIYDSTKLNISYGTEADMMSAFRTKKASTVVFTRELDAKEKEALKINDTIYVRELTVAYDAVALIANKAYNDSRLDMAALKTYFDPAGNKSTSAQLVFAGQGASAVNYVLGKLGYKEKISANVYALKSVEEVIDYVEKNNTAIGFVPFNAISDTDDERVKAIMKRIKVLSLRAKDENGQDRKVSANQSDIAEGIYPLTRSINAISRFTYEDNLDWLFVNFMYKERGAKIFLKAGLIPAKMPEREIKVNTDGLKGVN